MERKSLWHTPAARVLVGRTAAVLLGALLGAALDAGLLDGQFVEALRLALSGL
jgi:hypothetical protein